MSNFRSWDLSEPADAPPAAGAVRTAEPTSHRPVLDRIRAVAAAEPDSLAVQTPTGSLSYRQLLERADAVSVWLAARSGAAAKVALLTDKRPHAYSALLGALGAGWAFVPLDPEAPARRTRALLRRSGCRIVVCGREQLDAVGELAEHVLLVDEQPLPGQAGVADGVEPAIGRLITAIRDLPPAGPADLPPGADSAELAYLIFTSGSSGEPKGVQVERASLDTFATAIGELGQAGRGARVTQGAKLSFDASLQQIVLALTSGASLIALPDEVRVDGDLLLGWLDRQQITHLDSVPSLWSPLVRAVRARPSGSVVLPALRTVLLAGEAPRVDEVNDWLRLVPHARLLNIYGPTEATVDATAYEIRVPVTTSRVPVGRPLTGVRCRVLDGAGNDCEPHVEGEIHLGGPCLARGYLDDEQANARAFLAADGPDRLYRTGDLGYWLPDGNLVCTGRRDGQLKIRGVRIEPAEVEAALLHSPLVRQAAVSAWTAPGDAGTRLGAAVVCDPGCDPDAIRALLAEQLPPAMIPSRVLAVDSLPRGGSGKLDLVALRRLLEQGEAARPQPDAPGTSVDGRFEAATADVLQACRQVLGAQLGAREELFEHGLDSVSVLRLRAILRELGWQVSARQIFASRTAAELAAVTVRLPAPPDQATSAQAVPDQAAPDHAAPDQVVPVGRPLPLLAAQRAVLSAVLLSGEGSTVGLVQEVQHFDRRLSEPAVAAAVHQLIQRHEVLRVGFDLHGGPLATQSVHESLPPAPVPVRTSEDGTLDDVVAAVLDEQLRMPFDLGRPPLLRLVMIQTPQRSALVWTMHHLVTDGWSWEILSREFLTGYADAAAGRRPDLARPELSLADLVQLQAGRRSADTTSLIQQLRAAMPVELPAPAVVADTAAAKQTLILSVPPGTGTALRAHAGASRVTVGAVFLRAIGRAIGRLTRQQIFSLGLVTSGRPATTGAAAAVAPLATIVPFAFDVAHCEPVEVHEQIQRAAELGTGDVDPALAGAGLPLAVRAPGVTVLIQNYDSGLPGDGAASRTGLDPQRSHSRETAASGLAVVVYRDDGTATASWAIRLEFWAHAVDAGFAATLLREIRRELDRTVAGNGS